MNDIIDLTKPRVLIMMGAFEREFNFTSFAELQSRIAEFKQDVFDAMVLVVPELQYGREASAPKAAPMEVEPAAAVTAPEPSEEDRIISALRRSSGSRKYAARALDMTTNALRAKLKELGVMETGGGFSDPDAPRKAPRQHRIYKDADVDYTCRVCGRSGFMGKIRVHAHCLGAHGAGKQNEFYFTGASAPTSPAPPLLDSPRPAFDGHVKVLVIGIRTDNHPKLQMDTSDWATLMFASESEVNRSLITEAKLIVIARWASAWYEPVNELKSKADIIVVHDVHDALEKLARFKPEPVVA